MLTAIETTGIIEPSGRIVVDETFVVNAPTPVRVIVLFPENADIPENKWLQAAAQNEAFDFLHHPDEDIYSLTDDNPQPLLSGSDLFPHFVVKCGLS